MSKLKIKQVRSTNGESEKHRKTIRALGLHGIRDTVLHDDVPEIRGMVRKVWHLVEVEDVDD